MGSTFIAPVSASAFIALTCLFGGGELIGHFNVKILQLLTMDTLAC